MPFKFSNFYNYSVMHVLFCFLLKKPGVWFGEEAKKGQTPEPTENWFPVDWGQEDKEEEDQNKLFEVRVATPL